MEKIKMLSLDWSLPLLTAGQIMGKAWPLFAVLLGLVVALGLFSLLGDAIKNRRR
jgi:hypothetical protein